MAFDILHHDETYAAAFADIMDDRDVRMVERRRRFRLTREAKHPVLVRREISGQNFQRHRAIQPRVAREINLSHAAGAEQGIDLIVTEYAADERRLGRVAERPRLHAS